MRALLVRACLVLALAASPFAARAQLDPVFNGTPSPEQAARCDKLPQDRAEDCRRVLAAPALRFPAEAQAGAPVQLEMAIHKPAGPGPFPALVLLHTCAQLAENPQVRLYAEDALRAGYAVFIVDSFSQRAMGDHCDGRPAGPVLGLRVRDAAEALLHLARFDFIDPQRVAAVGFSQGARAVYILGREGVVPFYTEGRARFAALVSMYGECYNRTAHAAWLGERVQVPLLALLGERDEDGDPKECLPRLESAKAAGSPVEWYVFPGAGHSWDNERFVAWQRTPYRGAASGKVLQAYDGKVTADAHRRSFDFLARAMPSR